MTHNTRDWEFSSTRKKKKGGTKKTSLFLNRSQIGRIQKGAIVVEMEKKRKETKEEGIFKMAKEEKD